MPDIRIRNVPAKIHKSFLKEARRHKHSVEDEIRDAIFEYVIRQYPSQRALLIGKLSPSRRLRILRRERAYKHLIH
jgi:plasmid stability protein